MNIIKGTKEYVTGIGAVQFEGCESDYPLAFKWYDVNKNHCRKKLKDHVQFAVA